MGKISEALKKVQDEREKKAKVRVKEMEEKIAKIKEQEGVFDKNKKKVPPRLTLKDKIESIKTSEYYIAKPSADSVIDPRIITHFDYMSPVSEQYRILRTNLKSYLLKGAKSKNLNSVKPVSSPRIISVTSSLHSEGKSVTCVNLAVSLAKDLESKVVIIDCDLRKGSIHELLGISSVPGMAEILASDYDYTVALHPTKIDNLFVIPRGVPPKNPAELLDSKKMKLILEQLRAESISYVIIDTPPVITFTDASIICSKADAVALVVQAHRTQEAVVKKAKNLIQQAHGKFLGFILTQTDYYIPDLYSYYYYYRYRASGKKP